MALQPMARFSARALLFAVALAFVAIPFGLLLVQVTSGGPLTRYDAGVADGLNDLVHDRPLVVAVLRTISFLGKPPVLTVAVVVASIWLLRAGAQKLVVFLIVTCLGGGAVDTVVKVAVGRDRPVVDDPLAHALGKSFPSGHSMQTVVVWGALLLVFLPLLSRRRAIVAKVAYVLWALAMGTSRLALGVHFVTDVVGGFVLGAAWLCAMVAAFEIWREERGRRRTEATVEGLEPEAVPTG